jgi:quaternary ammonium compound-resistance protein SugE
MAQAWIILLFAGLFEVAWAVGLKFTDGFTKLLPSLWVGLFIVASLYMLALSQRTLPISIAYPVWMGIGAVGTVLVGTLFLKEPLSLAGWFFVALLILSLAGLKVWG